MVGQHRRRRHGGSGDEGERRRRLRAQAPRGANETGVGNLNVVGVVSTIISVHTIHAQHLTATDDVVEDCCLQGCSFALLRCCPD